MTEQKSTFLLITSILAIVYSSIFACMGMVLILYLMFTGTNIPLFHGYPASLMIYPLVIATVFEFVSGIFGTAYCERNDKMKRCVILGVIWLGLLVASTITFLVEYIVEYSINMSPRQLYGYYDYNDSSVSSAVSPWIIIAVCLINMVLPSLHLMAAIKFKKNDKDSKALANAA